VDVGGEDEVGAGGGSMVVDELDVTGVQVEGRAWSVV
jgi:hypothetical protein